MKLLSMIFMLVLGTSAAFADSDAEILRSINVTGRGEAWATCRPPASFCIDDVKRDAEAAGIRDAKRTCEMNHRGYQTPGSGYCSTSCFPNYIPPNGRPEHVNCRSNCQIRCEVE